MSKRTTQWPGLWPGRTSAACLSTWSGRLCGGRKSSCPSGRDLAELEERRLSPALLFATAEPKGGGRICIAQGPRATADRRIYRGGAGSAQREEAARFAEVTTLSRRRQAGYSKRPLTPPPRTPRRPGGNRVSVLALDIHGAVLRDATTRPGRPRPCRCRLDKSTGAPPRRREQGRRRLDLDARGDSSSGAA